MDVYSSAIRLDPCA